ncbi:hypothetical protein AYL99_01755 [Fonsecaea erecta]|uniref:Transcription factor domain-containing protein n=1 Tax=Fonsecaea erecta TaxID=1367422 RepID=A0A179A300_9EURO|nr:hypothetical protein AYL99_01755 [Fonsecaea erecta]OAP65783.1 hypothetical protein AYL99_01755 [Fonsecaea erecta]
MTYPRVFICYTHPSQFQDRQHRSQVKSYVSTRAYWIEQRARLGIRYASSRETKHEVDSDREASSLSFINFTTIDQALVEKRPRTMAGTRSTATGRRHAITAGKDFSLNPSHDKNVPAFLATTTPPTPIDPLPGILHRHSHGFAAANLDAVDANYNPIFHVFDVVNILGNNYYRQMQDEDAFHAGVAAMQVLRDAFVSSCSQDGPSAGVLRFVQIAISKLRDRIARHDRCNDDATIMTVLFLAHLAMAFGDMAAFRMHRRAIRDMVQSRGGLDKLNQDMWIKPTVRQFDTCWSQLHGDPMFTEDEDTRLIFYPKPPLTAEMRQIVDRIPFGFQQLVQNAVLSVEMVILLGRIAQYQKLAQSEDALTCNRRHDNFGEACPSLRTPGLNLEKYLTFSLLLYSSITFSPKRSLLEACHLVFGIPRCLLTKDLPSFFGKSPDETKCIVWMWLVLIASWTIANRTKSTSGRSLTFQLVERYPELRAWTEVKGLLHDFFSSGVLLESLQHLWEDLRLDGAEISQAV